MSVAAGGKMKVVVVISAKEECRRPSKERQVNQNKRLTLTPRDYVLA
jgi:hypothetical protein